MGDKHNFVALEWVKGEIAETLQQAHQSLAEHVEYGDDLASLQFCLAYIHQVHGTLQMVEVFGATLLAEEMELLAKALLNRQVANSSEAPAVLMEAILQLPRYLEQIQAARRDLPTLILPLLNDLRAVRGAELISQGSLFKPYLPASQAALSEQRLQQIDATQLSTWLRKIRQMVQMSLVGLLRGQDTQKSLVILEQAFANLEQLSVAGPLLPLWQAASALVEGLASRSIDLSIAVRALLWQLDSQLRDLLQQGVSGLNQQPPEGLLKNLLFYIARAQPDTPRIQQLHARYQLAEALPAEESGVEYGVLEPATLAAVVKALREELTGIKDSLDLFVRSEQAEPQALEGLHSPIKKVADTLAVLGFKQQRKLLNEQLDNIDAIVAGLSPLSEAALLELASALLYLEASLQSMLRDTADEGLGQEPLPPTDIAQVHRQVIGEARTGLEQTKEALTAFIAGQWQREALQQVPAALHQVRGGLAMIPLPRASALVAACQGYISEQLLEAQLVPSWTDLDHLAAAISHIDYYLERLCEDPAGSDSPLLDTAAASLAALGYGEIAPATEAVLEEQVPNTELQLEAAPAEAELASETVVASEPKVRTLVAAMPEQLSTATASPLPQLLPPLADEDPFDAELQEIFVEEAGEVQETLVTYFPSWQTQQDAATLGEIRRAFHTLKGSGRMVRALVVAELAWSVENLLNHVLDARVPADQRVVQLVGEVIDLLPQLVDEYAGQAQRQRNDVDFLAATAQALANQEPLPVQNCAVEQSLASTQPEPELLQQEQQEAELTPSLEDLGLDRQLVEIFHAEALLHLAALQEFLQQYQRVAPTGLPVSENLQRALHTLKGSAQMAGIRPMVGLAAAMEQLTKEYRAHLLDIGASEVELLEQAYQLLSQGVENLWQAPLAELDGGELLTAALQDCLAKALAGQAEQTAKDDPLHIVRLLAGELDCLLAMDRQVLGWQQSPPQPEFLRQLLAELNELSEAAGEALLAPLAELAAGLFELYQQLLDTGLEPANLDLLALARVHAGLLDMLDEVAAGQEVGARVELAAEVRLLLAGGEPPAEPEPAAVQFPNLAGTQPEPSAVQPVVASVAAMDTELDEEMVEIFLDEAWELLESANKGLEQWLLAPDNQGLLKVLMRDLHTLKGGARMAAVTALGDLSHELESVYEGLLAGRYHWAEGLGQLLHAAHDQLAVQLEVLQQGQKPPAGAALIERLLQFRQGLGLTVAEPEVVAAPLEQSQPLAAELTEVVELPSESIEKIGAGLLSDAPPVSSHQQLNKTNQEQVRVAADLLEDLVNLAGETSIFRSRIEQQVSDFSVTLGEMSTTLGRMRDQLRSLDIETQAQILSGYQSTEDDAELEFDPLEMDRHSQLQHLSRSLFESASDLVELKETLAARSHDAESLLQQQARVNTELQEGLMRTRMVPFERMVPRLRRIVRQVSNELHKQVELQVANAEGEIDRTVLERMTAPLEHMLRNAVGHGIELPQVRQAAGKPAQGRIGIELSREGADLLLLMSDDGAGINVEAVRRKAIDRGLMSASSTLSDQEIMQFILQSGFSTAEQVTQVAGRGVGMDVVGSEIRQLGGSISIESTPGQGTRFLVRLPFTVSVNRALMVMTGEELYAIPLNTIEGIVRVSSYELEALYSQAQGQGSPAYFEYAGQQYELNYLGDLLANGQQPKLVGQLLPLPVVLIRTSEHAVAVQVDSLLGSREIVVKSLGPQFAAVPSLSGATILGDGRVVVILDLLAAIRQQYARAGTEDGLQRQIPQQSAADRPALNIMVVDDSVTVRKVTRRLLERHGMQAKTAKDGVEAISLLQDYRPDLMLLDIEMPRMDGFEVASLVRHDKQLHDLPIIMITSRTGRKHRERAMALGVDAYLGKPYQEEQLLALIRQLTGQQADSL